MNTLNTAAQNAAATASQPAASTAPTQAKPLADIEGDDFELPVCNLNPNDPAYAGCEACQ